MKKESIEERLDWNKGFFINNEGIQQENLLFIYGVKDLNVHQLIKKKVLYRINGIASK